MQKAREGRLERNDNDGMKEERGKQKAARERERYCGERERGMFCCCWRDKD